MSMEAWACDTLVSLMPETIDELLHREIVAALGRDAGEIIPESRIVSDLGAESLDLVDLTFRLEKCFGIQIPQGELFEGKAAELRQLTVRQVAEYIAAKQISQRG